MRLQAKVTVHETKNTLTSSEVELLLVLQGDKNKDLDRTLIFARPGAAKRG